MHRSNALVLALTVVLSACGGAPSETGGSSTTALFGPVGSISDECVVDADCRTGMCDRTVPGGYCTAPCDESNPCPGGAYCTLGLCFATCESQAECRSAEFQCFEAEPGIGVCAFDVAAATPAGPNVGAPCRASVECAAPGQLEPYCVAELDLRGEPTGYVGGMCVALGCASDDECGTGARCISGAVSYCVPACAGPEECRPGYVCDEAVGACHP